MSSIPVILLCLPGFSLALYILFLSALYNTSLTSDDLPEPDTPVTQTNLPSGNLTFIFLRLFSSAPFISMYSPLPFLLFFGTGISYSPVKYLAVILFLFFITSSGVPSAITYPPLSPASGPISTR